MNCKSVVCYISIRRPMHIYKGANRRYFIILGLLLRSNDSGAITVVFYVSYDLKML